jgi:hypothetical protein
VLVVTLPDPETVVSKLRCKCGYTIVDQTDFLPHKAEVLSDQDSERIWDAAADAVADFISQDEGAARRRWIATHLGAHEPSDVDDAAVVYYIMRRAPLHLARTLYECSACGRLWLQARPGENRWLSYSPDEPGTPGILRSVAEPTIAADAGPE